MSITVDKLTKIYGSQKAVDHISFTIEKGEIVGFLGPNGAGKSTTMKIITGYLAASEGTATVCGITAGENNNETKKKIGYLPEANPLYHDMYVREYLDFISNIHAVKNKKEKIEEVIKTVGLLAEANKKTGQLSKGYKQRVGLAAALIHDPEVLILDEPTSGLDPNQIVEIREVIRKLGTDKTVLFSSHILQEVQAICDRVIIINNGTIVADDKLSSLLGKKHFNELRLELKEAVTEDIFEGIQNIKRLTANSWLFKTDDADSLKRKLIEITLNKNLNIVSLQSESVGNLEDIFRTLTTNQTNKQINQ
ncbi:MAG: gliding motility-associated ABC transporter ATP-binding subunit GldA [Chitinophagaceae bacterium]|nr:gliding motility-associated ABC transporter ATP-binding subunit GldA [Chitinophagaceae bacterium]MBK7558065.1 gliding motility-associated ABC transporter ATP-binding subunit GldA [Chitinophagaceae bacterium]MBK9531758.1 gliding motility-associated ABC transporter ATP-binding subunit GldA [Chitinophagaceae bacterium]